jgi:hypothetical protein
VQAYLSSPSRSVLHFNAIREKSTTNKNDTYIVVLNLVLLHTRLIRTKWMGRSRRTFHGATEGILPWRYCEKYFPPQYCQLNRVWE